MGKFHFPRTRIHHAEIASVQISQGEYYFSGRYKDFFPEGERSFFVGGKLGERHVKGSDLIWRQNLLQWGKESSR